MGNLYILLAIFLWSSLGIVLKLSGVSIHVLIFYSLLIAVVLQGIILSQKRYRKDIPGIKQLKYPLLLGCVGLLNNFTFFYAYKNTTIANAVLSHYTAPVIVAFLAAFFLKETITKNIVMAIVIASTGLLIMLNGFTLAEDQAAGIISGVISGFSYAVIIILGRIYTQNFSPLVLTFFSNTAILIMLAPFVREFPLYALWSFVIMGTVHSTIAPVLYYRGLQEVTANRTAVLGYLEPVSAIIFGMVFLKEMPGLNSIFGGILIIFSGYLTIIKSDRNRVRGTG